MITFRMRHVVSTFLIWQVEGSYTPDAEHMATLAHNMAPRQDMDAGFIEYLAYCAQARCSRDPPEIWPRDDVAKT